MVEKGAMGNRSPQRGPGAAKQAPCSGHQSESCDGLVRDEACISAGRHVGAMSCDKTLGSLCPLHLQTRTLGSGMQQRIPSDVCSWSQGGPGSQSQSQMQSHQEALHFVFY